MKKQIQPPGTSAVMAASGKIAKQFAASQPGRMLIAAVMLLLAAKSPAATINYVGSLDTNNVPEVNNWLTPSVSKTYDIDGDNIYGTFAAISWGDYTNYSSSTISFVDVPSNVSLDNMSGYGAQIDQLAPACGGSTGSGVAVNSTYQASAYRAVANLGNSVLHTNGSSLATAWMWHTFQVNSNLTGKTLRVGIMNFLYGGAGTINPHDQDSGKGVWIVQVAGGSAQSIVAPVNAGQQFSPPSVAAPDMTFFDIVNAQAGDQYRIYATRDLFVRSNPNTYIGAVTFDVANTASVPASLPNINTYVTSGYVNPTTLFGTPANPLNGGTNYGYVGVIRTNCDFQFAVIAGSATPVTYQWYHDVNLISNATNATYYISHAQLSDSGNYSVVVKNNAGAVTNSAYSLSVLAKGLAPQVASYRAKAFATPGLFAYYGFDNGPKDMYGNHDGYFVGTPGCGVQIGSGFGSAVAGGQYDGTNSEMGLQQFGAGAMQIPYDPGFDFNNANQEGTIVMWVRTEWCWTGSYRQSFLFCNGTNGNARYGINVGRTKSGIAAYRYDPNVPTSSANPISLNAALPGGQIGQNGSGGISTVWNMVVAVFSNSTYTAYMDGVQLPASSSGPATNQAFAFGPVTGNPITIGAIDFTGGYNWNGGIDEIAVYTNALSSDQIKALFNAADLPYAVNPQPVGGPYAPGDNYGMTFGVSNNWNTGGWLSSAQPSTTFTPNPLNYQWYLNNAPLSGTYVAYANTPTIPFSGMANSDAGTYYCVATNVAGSVTSSPVVITIQYPVLNASTTPGVPKSVNVSYPGSYTNSGWILQSAPSLAPPVTWTPVSNTTIPVTNSVNGGDVRYFRLSRPY
jgi:Concanavalin A-like lectin/glucanases superfamily